MALLLALKAARVILVEQHQSVEHLFGNKNHSISGWLWLAGAEDFYSRQILPTIVQAAIEDFLFQQLYFVDDFLGQKSDYEAVVDFAG